MPSSLEYTEQYSRQARNANVASMAFTAAGFALLWPRNPVATQRAAVSFLRSAMPKLAHEDRLTLGFGSLFISGALQKRAFDRSLFANLCAQSGIQKTTNTSSEPTQPDNETSRRLPV